MSEGNEGAAQAAAAGRAAATMYWTQAQLAEMEAYCKEYMAFLDAGKTERLSAREAVAAAEARPDLCPRRGMALKAGDKVYICNRGGQRDAGGHR